MTKLWKLPKPEDNKEPSKEKSLPFDGSVLTSKHFSFSFACFDRSHKLFNLGSNTSDGVVSGKWFLILKFVNI